VLISFFILLLLNSSILTTAQDDNIPPTILDFYPLKDDIITTKTPIIYVNYSDDTGIDTDRGIMKVDGFPVTMLEEETEITGTYIQYTPSEIFQLEEGNHTVYVELFDLSGNKKTLEWSFSVNITLLSEEERIDVFSIVLYIILGSGIATIALFIYILYLKKTKKFTFKKYFAQHPLQKEYIILYLPIILAFVFVILAFLHISSTPNMPTFSFEYVLVIGVFIGGIPYTIDSMVEKRRILRYERAFAQLLFEMADAMRGGLDPAKTIIELAKTDIGILRHYIKRAADAVKLGRPFDEVIQSMARPFKSALIERYSSLIGEASKIGGETSLVIYRAAKDMDDFIKVNQERRRELAMQTSVIYIAFIVTLIIIYILLTMFPTAVGLDMSLLTNMNLQAAAEGQATSMGTRLSTLILKRRFFHVVLINSMGTGIIIGEFSDGKIKYGLIHSLIMVAISVIFFAILII
jgi:archaellum biogenesis protein FlaJ (TadC family)